MRTPDEVFEVSLKERKRRDKIRVRWKGWVRAWAGAKKKAERFEGRPVTQKGWTRGDTLNMLDWYSRAVRRQGVSEFGWGVESNIKDLEERRAKGDRANLPDWETP